MNKVSSKDSFLPLKSSELSRIKKYDDLTSFLLKRYKIVKHKSSSSDRRKFKSVNDAVNKALKNELHWAEWKGTGCKPFSNSMDDDKKAKFWDTKGITGSNLTQQDKNKWFHRGVGNVIMPDYSKQGKRTQSTEGWFGIDKFYTHMDALDRGNIMVSSSTSKNNILINLDVKQTY